MASFEDDLINLDHFEVQENIDKINSWKYKKIIDINNGRESMAMIFTRKPENIHNIYLFDFSREINIMSRINYPSILKFKGYSLTNFKSKEKPVIITEFASKIMLQTILFENDQIDIISKFNDTKKLINIYGIASAMMYLHSYNIIHRGLDIHCIFLDENFYPKLFRFNDSIVFPRNSTNIKSANLSEIRGVPRYLSPEVLSSLEYSKSSDVYAFAIIFCEIMNGETSFGNYCELSYFVAKVLNEGERPQIKNSVADCYKNLIRRCWAQNPDDRPTFNEIITELKSNPKFITKGVDSDEFYKYIQFIEESEINFSEPKNHPKLEEFIEKYAHEFDRAKVNLGIREKASQNIDLSQYELKNIKLNKNGYSLYEIINKDEQGYTFEEKIQFYKKYKKYSNTNNKSLCAQVYSKEINKFYQHEIVNFGRKLSILSQINHPAILNFIGYSPVDFDNKNKPVIITEFWNYLYSSTKNFCSCTRILMNIYGIASAMSYLHSHGIIHRDLKISNIYIDINKLPKLSGFDISKKIDDQLEEENKKIKGTPAYIAPEIYNKQEYSKASDVYSFGLLMYRIITKYDPFENLIEPNELKHAICEENKRPEFLWPINKAYRNLIERCWAQDPKMRPTFDEILKELKTNPDFITEEVNKKDYFEYIKYIDEFPTTFNETKRIKYFDETISSYLHTFASAEPYPGLKDMYETETNDLSFNYNFFNIENFDIRNIGSGYLYHFYLLYDKSNIMEKYVRKDLYNYSENDLSHFTEAEIKNFIQEMKIISQLNHPTILKYFGYISDPLYLLYIILEYSPNGSLYDFFEKSNKKFPDMTNDIKWDETKKLIYFYGIAVGMAYLHSHNIIHRDLKISNILLDKHLYPKISGFNISTRVTKDGFLISKELKGTPAYLAPEIYLKGKYSKSSDIYSFGLIMYEILSGEKPFNNIISPKEIKRIICEEQTHHLNLEKICEPYKGLIKQCVSQESQARPTFESIVKKLRTNREFIIKDVNEEEYHNFIQHIDDSPISFDSSKQLTYPEDSIKNTNAKYRDNNIKINIKGIYETELNNILFDHEFVNIQNYEKQKLIYVNDDFKLYKISDKKTGTLYQAKKKKSKFENLVLRRKKGFCNEINFYLKANHPSFLRFIGYSPVDFKNRNYSMIITEYGTIGSLEKVLEIDMKNPDRMILNPTKRLIILYGIASGMSYMHSNNLFHSSLKTSNIYLDEYLFPRISEFDESKLISESPISELENMIFPKYDYIYHAPERAILSIECTSSDVYSFALIAYQLISNELPFEKVNWDLLDKINEDGLRPEIKNNIPECYRNLIEKCWSLDLKDRPTFDEIVYHLKTNPEFITESINKEEFESYVNFLDEFQSNQNSIQLDDFIKMKTQTFRKVKLDFKKIRNPTKLDFTVNIGSIDLDNYEKISKIGSGSFGNVYKVIHKETQNIFAAKISIYEIDQCSNDTIINLSREIDIISKLNHPSILQFVGFNSRNFKNKPKPIIITEFASNYSLDKIIENQRLGLGNIEWNDTKKLINIYGIASGMAYLHHLDILHRDIKPGNILLDDFLYPKIADFGLSKMLYKDDEFESKQKHPITSGFKGTYAYCSPEILSKHEYSKSGDVYAFGMIVYEIMTSEVLFKGFNQYKLVSNVIHGYRPKFNIPIPYCYRKLIEKCWADDRRPSFDQIVKLLETDPSFITSNVDKEEYLNHISLIHENSPSCVVFNQSSIRNDNITVPAKTKFVKKSSINLKINENEDEREVNVSNEKRSPFLDLTKFERKEIISRNDSPKVYKLVEIKNGYSYAGQISMLKINKLCKTEIAKLTDEIYIISKLKHPRLLKFVGYSLTDFKKQRKPVIVTEYFNNGSLASVLELDRIKQPIEGWNSTKKLINLYGIASGMSYLHSQGILHKSLKPTNIFLDDILTPKLGDFGLSTKFEPSENITMQSISGIKATPIHSSPEVLLSNEYTKSSDVYSFAFIAYEMICNEVPFSEIVNHNQIFDEVVNNQKRPNINENTPLSYRKLIERCWSQTPNERPTFDEIVYYLKIDSGFITESINCDDYQKYIRFVEEQIETIMKPKIDETETNNQD